MKIVIIGIVIAIIIIYVSYYYRYPKEVSILQTRLEDFSLQALLEKQPIVIQDLVKDMTQLRKAWFNANITYNDVYEHNNDERWLRNRFKYMFLKPEQDTEILLYPANLKMIKENDTSLLSSSSSSSSSSSLVPDPNESIIAIKLKKDQIVVIPIHWHYLLNKTVFTSFGVHDYITIFLP